MVAMGSELAAVRGRTAARWTGLVLILLFGALVWLCIEPGSGRMLGIRLPGFWWHLGQVGLLAAYTFFLGWVQGVMNWTPAEVSLEPPAHPHDDPHGHHHDVSHGHGHVDHHSVTEPTHTDNHGHSH